MGLRHFLDAGYALLVEEYQRLGSDFLTAIDRVNESIGLAPATAVAVTGERVPSETENDRALAELQKMMSGL